MKKSCVVTLLMLFLFTTYLLALGENNLKDINTLRIFIGNSEYTSERFLGENGMLYTCLDELKQVLSVNCSPYNTGAGYEVYISYGDHIIPFKYGVICKNDKIYVPLTSFCQTLGYELQYDYSNNILAITDPAATANVSPSNSYGNTTSGNINAYTYYPLGLPPNYYPQGYYPPNYYSQGYYPPNYYAPQGYYPPGYSYPVYQYSNCYPTGGGYQYESTSTSFGIQYNTCNNRFGIYYGNTSVQQNTRIIPYVNSEVNF